MQALAIVSGIPKNLEMETGTSCKDFWFGWDNRGKNGSAAGINEARVQQPEGEIPARAQDRRVFGV